MRALSPDMTTHTIEGTKITVPLHTKWAYNHFLHPHEPTLSHDFVSEIRSADTVYDIGAYLGWYTLLASKMATQGRVVGFEPHPQTFKRLEQVAGVADGRIELLNVGLSDSEQTIRVPARSSSGTSLYEHAEDVDMVDIRVAQGDDLIETNDLPAPNVVKIDVEGAEVAVLNSMRETLKRDECRVVYCEIHPQFSPLGNRVFSVSTRLFEQMDFRWIVLPDTERVT
jgi:FkbM family methyltransferase